MKLVEKMIATLGFLAMTALLTNTLPGCAEQAETEIKPEAPAAERVDADPNSHVEAPVPKDNPVELPELSDSNTPLFRPPARPEAAVLDSEPVAVETPAALKKSALSVVESATCLNVEKRIPEGISSHFNTESGAVWAFVKVNNPGTATHIKMLWKRDNKVRAQMRLRVGKSPGWRTWSRMRLRKFDQGEWTVEVRDDNNTLIHELLFDVKAPTNIKS